MPHEKRRKARYIEHGTFAAVIRAFMVSPKFDALAKATRRNYGYLLRAAELPDGLGAVPVDEMRPALVQAFLDGFADRPAAQAKAKVAIKSLEKWALVRDLLPRPISLGTETIDSNGGHTPWTDEQVEYAERHARPHLSRIITMAANTGQRGSDLIRMRWSDIEVVDGRPGINVEQVKTGLKLWVPFTAALQTAMTTWERRPGFILVKADGRPFTRPQVTDLWIRERRREEMAPLRAAGVVLHGLRGTAVVRLRRAGATIPQISDMVGMSAPMVTRYCRYSVQRENALAAVYTLDRTARETKQRKEK
jgi:integrase